MRSRDSRNALGGVRNTVIRRIWLENGTISDLAASRKYEITVVEARVEKFRVLYTV